MQYSLSDDTWSKAEIEAIERVIKSNRFSMGEEVKEFERRFAEKISSKFAVMSNSGSSANLLAIAALVYSGRLAEGDEVIVPAVSWSTTFFPIHQHRLRLRFIDIDPDTLNIDLEKLKNGITAKTRAIFCVNLLGNANDYDAIKKICSENNLILIEDNCESLGGRFNNKQLGTFGLLGTFSTFYSHHLCTMEGGMTVTDDEEMYHYLLSIRAHGWTRNLPKTSKIYEKQDDEFFESFNFIVPGYNLRPLEMEGAIGIEQLKKMDKIIEQRRQNAVYFLNNVKTIKDIRTQKEIGESSWFGFSMVLEGNLSDKRKTIVNHLKKNGIEVRPIVAGNFTRNAAIKYLDHSIYDQLRHADEIHNNGFFVGNHSKNNYRQIDLLLETLDKVVK